MRELGASGVEAKVLKSPKAASWPISDGRFEVGSRVWLMLPGRERANAVVKWTAGDKIGAEFAEPISLEGFEHWPDCGWSACRSASPSSPLRSALNRIELVQPAAPFARWASAKGNLPCRALPASLEAL